MAIRQCIRKVCLVLYALPTYGQALRCVWDAIAIDGVRYLDLIPKELIQSTNRSEMSITFTNGSKLKLIGADSYDTSLVGTNAQMIILSEAALMQLESVYSYARPILAANDGTIVILSTPRGKNSFWQLYKSALELKDWFVLRMGVSETKHIPEDVLAVERTQMSPELYAQEYEVSFDKGVDGLIYGRELEMARLQDRIGFFPHDPTHLTHLVMDLGVSDATALLWFQTPNDGDGVIRIIDAWSGTSVGVPQIAKIIGERPYRMGKTFFPNDIEVREFGSGAISRYEKFNQLGIKGEVLPQYLIDDGIDNLKAIWPRIYINELPCKGFLRALEQYHREYDEQKEIYKSKPVHDWSSNYCFTADTMILTRRGMRQIIDLCNHDEILTLQGWKQCSAPVKTKINAKLVEVIFQDGTRVKCTPEHLFLTKNGWRSAESLTNSLEIQSSLMNLHNILTDISIESSETSHILPKEGPCFIEKYGKTLLEKSLKIAISTIKTITSKIINFGTWFAYQLKNILIYQKNQTQESVINVGQQPHDGMDRLKVDYGINDMQKNVKHGLNGNMKRSPVFGVKNYIKPLLGKMDTNKSFVTTTAKPCIIETVNVLSKNEDVYCIYVADIGHFSLSNGAIVKNCDALRYLGTAVHRCKRSTSQDEINRQVREAIYGSSYAPTDIFRRNSRYNR